MRDFVDVLPSIVQQIRDSSICSWIDAHSQGPEQAQESVQKIARSLGAAAGGVVGFAVIYGLSAWALGLPFPLALAFIAGFLDLIPIIGAIIAGVILVLAALTQGLTAALIMLAIVLVFGTLLGAVGAIIAVPIVAAIQIVIREVTAKRRAAMAALKVHNAAAAAEHEVS